MKNPLFVLSISMLFIANLLIAQADDPVLFTVNDDPVRLSEFNYIYAKTNGEKADYSRASLKEYLDLYIKFKLKVQKAKDMQLDTIPSLQQELAGYRRQLANSYLIDKEVTEQLTRELYDRMQEDLELSHIMIAMNSKIPLKDTIAYLVKARKIMENIEGGSSFEEMAEKFSDDESSKGHGGRIGYVTAMLPDGFYALETAAYNAPVGKIVGPVRTKLGYHIIKVNKRRPARGEITVAHILIRDSEEKPNPNAKSTIEYAITQAKGGMKFDQLAKVLSEDKNSASQGGQLPAFGINRYEKSFEEAAFALENDGDLSAPVKTSAGWHLIKRIEKSKMEPYEDMKARLQVKIKRDSRYKIAQRAMIERIKMESNFSETRSTLENYVESIDESFTTHRWRPAEEVSDAVLFSLGQEEKYTVSDFEVFLGKSSRDRMQMGQNANAKEIAYQLYENFVDQTLLDYEERHLEDKYPDFKALMREYEEGILLFEATKLLVWDRASQDSTGLVEFHKTQPNKYSWGPRVKVSTYTLSPEASDQLDRLKKYARKKSPEKVLAKFNKEKEIVKWKEEVYERGKNEVVDKLEWEKGSLSDVEMDKRDDSLNFLKIESVMPSSPKSLKEARGYVVADYQDHLEKKWLESLQKDYPINVNESVFEQLVKD